MTFCLFAREKADWFVSCSTAKRSRSRVDEYRANMFITCKCLNVSIRTRGAELKGVKEDDIELSPVERADGFFREVNFNRIYREYWIDIFSKDFFFISPNVPLIDLIVN